MSTRYYLGIDAGGTKTHALIADEHGRVVGGGQSGPGNWESIGLDGAYESYQRALDDALRAAGLARADLRAAGYALAGLDWQSDHGRLEPVVARLTVPGPRILVNDTFGALRAGSTSGCGVVVIAGTGSTIAGRNQHGAIFRTFGLGAIWGDFQGASGLAWGAARAIGHAYFGRGPATALTDAFLQVYGVADVPEMVERASRGEADWPNGRLAPLVFAIAAEGDAVAQQIVREAGEDLGLTTTAVARKLNLAAEPFDLVLAGGIFRSRSTLLVDALAAPVRAYAPQARVGVLDTPPVAGSVLLAFDAASAPVSPEAHARLVEDARRWFESLA